MARNEVQMTLGLDSSKFKQGIAKAGEQVKGFATTSVQHFKKLHASFTSVASVANVVLASGLVAAAKAALNYGKEMTNLARLSGEGFERFQELAHGAKSVGIETDKLGDIFKDVQDKVGDFMQTGGGPMKDFFENIAPAIGVTADQFKNLSGKDALQLYYDSLSRANLSQEEMTFYMEAIANDATKLIPLLKEGGKAWEIYAAEARAAGLVMDETTAKRLKEAEKQISSFTTRLKIASGEFVGNPFKFLWEQTSIPLQLAKRWEEMQNFFNAKNKAEKAAEEATKAAVEAETEADRKSKKERTVLSLKLAKLQEQIAKEQDGRLLKTLTAEEKLTKAKLERNAAEILYQSLPFLDEETRLKLKLELEKKITTEKDAQTDVEKTLKDLSEKTLKVIQDREDSEKSANEKHLDATEKRKQLENELSKLTKGTIEWAKKHLEVQEAITVEKNASKDAESELKDAVSETARAAAKIVEELKEKEEKKRKEIEEQIRLRDEQIEQQMKGLELERAIAESMGDNERVNALDRQIERQSMINELVREYGMHSKDAAALVDNIIAQKEEQKQKELEVLKAQADGNEMLAEQLQGRIDKEQEAIDLMNEFNLSLGEATKLAEKLARMRAGPDLDASGFVTRGEQREFDRRQKEQARQRAKAAAEEEMIERGIGGGLLGKRIPEDPGAKLGVGGRAEQAAEKAAQRRDIQEAQKLLRRGEFGRDQDAVQKAKDFVRDRAEERGKRNEAERQWKEGGADPNARFDLNGNLLPPGAPGGPGGPKQPEPKQPNADVVKAINDNGGKLDKIIQALQC